MRIVFVFLITFLTAGITIAKEALLHFGIDTNYLFMALIAIVVAGLMANQRLFLVVLVCGLSVTINLPDELLTSKGIDRDLLLGTVIALILIPTFVRQTGFFSD